MEKFTVIKTVYLTCEVEAENEEDAKWVAQESGEFDWCEDDQFDVLVPEKGNDND